MDSDQLLKSSTDSIAHGQEELFPKRSSLVASMKARQSAKIRQIGEALVIAGFAALDEQAQALGLPRSTTWTILKGNHKSSGLSATIINRMLSMPRVPASVRAKIVEYVEEKSAGLYGDNRGRLRQFTARVTTPELRPPERSSDQTLRSSGRCRRMSAK